MCTLSCRLVPPGPAAADFTRAKHARKNNGAFARLTWRPGSVLHRACIHACVWCANAALFFLSSLFCGFPQVASSLIKAPPGGAGSGAGSTTLERQCREQGVATISSSGASLGGFAADEWAHRAVPSTVAGGEHGLSLDSRQVCWSRGCGARAFVRGACTCVYADKPSNKEPAFSQSMRCQRVVVVGHAL